MGHLGVSQYPEYFDCISKHLLSGCAVRVLGRRIPRSSRVHPGSSEGNRQRDRDDEDDSANQGPPSQTHSHS